MSADHLSIVADVRRQMDELRAGTYRGADPAGLAVVVVDGDGFVVDTRLARTIARHPPDAVGDAVRLATAAARQQLVSAFEDLARRTGAVA